MANKKILIAGAGIAGPVLAWWLDHWGFTPTLIERAAGPRPGGSVIDFWGGAWDVVERMGLASALHQADYAVNEVRLVNAAGRRLAAFNASAFRRLAHGRIASLRRGELAAIFAQPLRGKVPVQYGVSVEQLRQDADGVDVVFSSGKSARFDLVIASDGLHSGVRELVLGPGAKFVRNLGYHAAVWTAPDYPHRDEGSFVSFAVPGGQLGRWSLRNQHTAFLCVYVSPLQPEPPVTTLRRLFAHAGWECDAALASLDAANDLYADSVSQTHLPGWSHGRVAFLGDAAYSPSLLAGQGAALATLGAYVLAGELMRSPGDHSAAFANYERILRPLTTDRQRSAHSYAGWFAPRTRFGVFARNWGTWLLSAPPLTAALTRNMLDDKFALPFYAESR